MIKRLVLFLLVGIFFCFLVNAGLDVSLSHQGTDLRYNNGTLVSNGNLTVLIYDALSGGNLVYNETFFNGIVDGSWNVLLGENESNPLTLFYGVVYYQDLIVNGEDFDFTNYLGQSVERKLFYSPLGAINATDYLVGLNESFNLSSDSYFLMNEGVLGFNDTRLNATIDSRFGSSDVGPFTNNTTTIFIKGGYPEEFNLGIANLSLGERINMMLGVVLENFEVGVLRIYGNVEIFGNLSVGSINSSGDLNVGNSVGVGGNVSVGGGISLQDQQFNVSRIDGETFLEY